MCVSNFTEDNEKVTPQKTIKNDVIKENVSKILRNMLHFNSEFYRSRNPRRFWFVIYIFDISIYKVELSVCLSVWASNLNG